MPDPVDTRNESTQNPVNDALNDCLCDDSSCVNLTIQGDASFTIENLTVNCGGCCGEDNGEGETPVTPPGGGDPVTPPGGGGGGDPVTPPGGGDGGDPVTPPADGGCPQLGRNEPCDQQSFAPLSIDSATQLPGHIVQLLQLAELDGSLFLGGTLDYYGAICRLNEDSNTLSHLKTSKQNQISQMVAGGDALYAMDKRGYLLKLDKELNLLGHTQLPSMSSSAAIAMVVYQDHLYLGASKYLYKLDADLQIVQQCDIGAVKAMVVNDQGIYALVKEEQLLHINLAMTEQRRLTFSAKGLTLSTLSDNQGQLLVTGYHQHDNSPQTLLAHISYDLSDIRLTDQNLKKGAVDRDQIVVPACDGYLRLCYTRQKIWVTLDTQGCGWAGMQFNDLTPAIDGLRRSTGDIVWVGQLKADTIWLHNERVLRGDTMADDREDWPGDWIYISSSEVTTALADAEPTTVSTTAAAASNLTVTLSTLTLKDA